MLANCTCLLADGQKYYSPIVKKILNNRIQQTILADVKVERKLGRRDQSNLIQTDKRIFDGCESFMNFLVCIALEVLQRQETPTRRKQSHLWIKNNKTQL